MGRRDRIFFARMLLRGLTRSALLALALLSPMLAGAQTPDPNSASINVTASPNDPDLGQSCWRLPDQAAPLNAWHNSGETVNGFAPGFHRVEFRANPDYLTPPVQLVRLVRGNITKVTGLYQFNVTTYNLRDPNTFIPAQQAAWGQALRMEFVCDNGYDAAVTAKYPIKVECTPQPTYPPTIKAWSRSGINEQSDLRLLEFWPSATYNATLQRGPDVQPFKVKLTLALPTQTIVKEFEITPVPWFTAEAAVFTHAAKAVDPTSPDYIKYEEKRNPAITTFNGKSCSAQGGAREVTISGKEIVFQRTAPYASIFYKLDGRVSSKDLYSLTINAETVRVRDRIWLPQTGVTINARKIIFENTGTAPLDPGCIDVTPADWTTLDGTADEFTSKSGANGLSPRPFTLNVETVDLGPNPAAPAVWRRLKINGGKGQQGGKGLAGDDGVSYNVMRAKPELKQWINTHLQSDGNFTFTLSPANLDIVYNGCEWITPNSPDYASCLGKVNNADGDTYGVVRLTTWYHYEPWKYATGGLPTPYTETRPRNGGDAKLAPGKGGTGGTGGDLLTPPWIKLATGAWENNGGSTATPRPPAPGGKRGQPSLIKNVFLPTGSTWYWNWGQTGGAPANEFLLTGGIYPTAQELNAGFTKDGAAKAAPVNTIIPMPGKLLSISGAKQLSWLTPSALRQIILYARDNYLNGNLLATGSNLLEYDQLLNTYRQNTTWWSALPQRDRDDFTQMQGEIETLLHSLASNCDYFGYPAGWAPMLSLEFSQSMYSLEIPRSIRILYLAYWLRTTNKLTTARQAALKETQNQLRQQLTEMQNQRATGMTELQAMQQESLQLQSRIEQLRQAINSRLAWLMHEAELNAERKADVPGWKKFCRVASAVCSVVPVGQPYLAIAGAGLNILASAENTEQAVQMGVDSLASDYSASGLGAALAGLGTIDVNALYNDPTQANIKNAATRAANASKAMRDSLSRINAALANRTADRGAVESELAQLLKEDQVFSSLHKSLGELMTDNEAFSRQLAAQVQKLTALTDEIAKNILADQSVTENLTNIADAMLTQRTDAYLQDMEKRARERLLRYHYYMVKAYEYRMLKPYTGELNLNNIANQFIAFTEKNSASPVMTSEQYAIIEALYQDALAQIANEIYTTYQNNNIHLLSDPVPYTLNASQLAALNRGEAVKINFFEESLILPWHNDQRIVSLKVTEMAAQRADGSPAATDNEQVQLTLAHSGLSRLVSGGRTYLFRHYHSRTDQPIQWLTTYRLKPKAFANNQFSPTNYSLLKSLLQGKTDSDLEFFMHPGVWADLTLKAKSYYVPSGAKITKLKFALVYDFLPGDPAKPPYPLTVKVDPPDLRPYITMSAKDLAQRSNGRGFLMRYMATASTVQLNAPATYGDYKLLGCYDQFGKAWPKSATGGWTVPVNDSKTAVFRYKPVIKAGAEDDWALYE